MKATWKNGKRTVTGFWSYDWASDRFTVILDSRDRITGQQKQFLVAGSRPEWGNWRLVRDSCVGTK